MVLGKGCRSTFLPLIFVFLWRLCILSLSGSSSSRELNHVPGWFAVLKINLTMEIISFRVVLSSEFFLENADFLIKGGSPIGI